MNLKSAIYFIAAVVILLALGYVYYEHTSTESDEMVAPISSTDNQPESDLYTTVGANACAECHKAEYDLWRGSDHDHAMQEASEQTVLGDFNNIEFDYFDTTSRFYQKDGKYKVLTDGPDGELKGYEVKYTFGIYPLQQYLIEFPDGRLQALSIAWDSRPFDEGGQRWFHLYPNEKIIHTDRLHWTGIDQNWNFMCAECHSTNLKKNYDLDNNTFRTTWSEINVSCEACHGSGSDHIKWAEQRNTGKYPNMGLLISFNERKGVSWEINDETGNAVRSKPLESHTEIEVCARCHSRRSLISENYVYGKTLLDTHMPALLEEGIYYPDGQIQAEDYEWGSFIQSKMYHKGVTCTDCHNAHNLQLRAEGNSLCVGCHKAQKFDTPSHHHHKELSTGSSCVGCHMPETNYMVIDARRDHSIRIPRPDLSDKIGTPNACNKCHADRSAEWASSTIEIWNVKGTKGYQEYGEALYAARNGVFNAEELLVKLAGDTSSPSIARATALMELEGYLSPNSIASVKMGLKNEDPLIRGAALDALQSAPPDVKLGLAFELLSDQALAVRLKAVSLLAAVPRENLTNDQIKVLDQAVEEYVNVQRINADRPEAHLNLGLVYSQLGRIDEAEAQYNTAIEIEPSFIPAYVNLADLYRIEKRDTEGKNLLQTALEIDPKNGDIYHSLGLLLIRQNSIPEAIKALKKSVELNPDNSRYSYVYAVALNDMGNTPEAIRVLESALAQDAANKDILYALITFNINIENINHAIEYAEKLLSISPGDPNLEKLVNDLKKSSAQ